MNDQDWKIGAIVTSEDGTSGTGVIISDASVIIDGVERTIIRDPIGVSTGKTKNKDHVGGRAYAAVSITSPSTSHVETSLIF